MVQGLQTTLRPRPMENPLLSPQIPLPFDRIQVHHIKDAIETLITQAKDALDAIAATTERDYEHTFGALDASTKTLEVAMGMVEHLESVNTSELLRAAYNVVQPQVSAFYSGIILHAGLYQALRRYAETGDHSRLSPTERRYMEKTLDEFRRHGAELDHEGKQQLQELDRQLSEKTTQFSQNVLDGTNSFELYVPEERLAGLPEFAKKAARKSAADKGKPGYRLTLQAPSVVPVLTYADDAELRKEVLYAYNTRGTRNHDNIALITEILRLRKKKAQLLGFDNFADLVTADRMAKTSQTAVDFIADLRTRTEAAFRQENAELLAFRRELEGNDAPELMPWDISYYAEKQRKKLYDFDEEQLRPYFSAPRVLSGAFDLAAQLYGLRIEPTDAPTWHESAEACAIFDEQGRQVGLFYTDLYPRESKRDGAWMHGLVAAAPPAPHVALFCANAQPPTDDAPSLMSFRDVETIFHEFGHLLHHCLSSVPVRSLACTRVAQDFVELPSQIMENWCSEKAALDRFAKHYQTGETIPAELVEKMIAARNYRAGNAQMRQLSFADVDLALHVVFDPDGDEDVNVFANRILQRYSSTTIPAEFSLISSFSHLFAHPVGYAAGYYSYKWAEVLDADAFTRFKQEGLFSREVGEAFRRSILSRGDSAEPQELFLEFMGRPPQVGAMLERQGLLHSA